MPYKASRRIFCVDEGLKPQSSSQGGTSNFHIKYIDSLETFKEDNFIIEETKIKNLVKYL
jgi:hypothetical protein